MRGTARIRRRDAMAGIKSIYTACSGGRCPLDRNFWAPTQEMTMRLIVLSALAVTAFSATMTVETPDANAVVYCAAGVVRAGCVVRPGVAPTARGVARRTTRRVIRRSDMML